MKNLKIVFIIILLISNLKGFCQNNKFNLVIFLNDELIEEVYHFRFFDSDSLQYSCKYTIGELIINDDFSIQKFKEKPLNYFKFKFDILETTKYGSIYNEYEVVLENLFLERKFIVIRLYNLEFKKYRRRIKKKSLTYDYNIFSNGVIILNL